MSPTKPVFRAASTALRPASDAPTTTSRFTGLSPGLGPPSALNSQCLCRASGDGLLDRLQFVAGDVLLQKDERTIVVDLEELGRHRLADAQPRALGEIDYDLHGAPPSAPL